MKSYAEKNSLEKIDWKEVLCEGRECPTDTLRNFREKAHKWTTCPCGQLPAIIKRNKEDGEPEDKILTSFGVAFYESFMNHNFTTALHYLNLINVHGAFLADIEKENKIKEISKIEEKLAEMRAEVS